MPKTWRLPGQHVHSGVLTAASCMKLRRRCGDGVYLPDLRVPAFCRPLPPRVRCQPKAGSTEMRLSFAVVVIAVLLAGCTRQSDLDAANAKLAAANAAIETSNASLAAATNSTNGPG